MKNKIGYVIIGMLIGAIITSSIFLVQIKEMREKREENQIEKNEKMLQQPSGEMMEPPERDNQEQPPEKPNESNNPQNENTSKENKI